MAHPKPFHRNVRGIKPGPNSGYSGWAFILDREYARDPEHYVRALNLIQNDLREIFDFLEPSDETRSAFSYRIHALLMRTCVEVEANFKAILNENRFTPPASRSLNMSDYQRVELTHHLSSYEVMLPIWNGLSPVFRPFEAWEMLRHDGRAGQSPVWYRAYNASKHDRHEEFKQANLETLILAVSGLLALVSSQFGQENFGASSRGLDSGGYEYHPMQSSIGGLFRISFPNDWAEDEIYDFNWSELSEQTQRFNKIDFNSIGG